MHKASLIEGPVPKVLVKMTISMAWGILAIISFHLVDSYFIGKLGTETLAAISFTFPVTMVLTNMAIGLGIGVSSLLSRVIGAGDVAYVRRITTYGLVFAGVLACVLSVLCLVFIHPLFDLLGASLQSIAIIEQYMSIWFAFMPFLIVPMIANFALRGAGDATTPAYLMTASSLINLILDPLLIFGFGPIPALGVRGAAIATAVAWLSTCIWILYVLAKPKQMISFEGSSLLEFKQSIQKILHVGLPACLANMIVPFSMGVITRMIADYGPEAVAAFGVCSRVEMFALILPYALSSVIGPFVGQNFGSQKFERIAEAFEWVFRFASLWGLSLAVLLALGAKPIMMLFDQNPRVIEIGVLYLRIVPLSYIGYSIVMIISASFNSLGKPLPTTVLSVLRMFGLYVPLAILLSRSLGFRGIFMAAALANLLSGLVAYAWNHKHCRKYI